MSDNKGYKDTKEFICTGCRKKIILTKFASQKTCKCDECKANNVPTNPDIVAEALKTNPPKERKKSDGGDTKTLPCIECGTMVEVSKFMSAQKVLCDKCKGVSTSSSHIVSSNAKLQVDKSKFSKMKIAPLEEYEMNGGIIANKRLREVICPACGHEHMKPLMIADWSQFGLIIHYQCPECLLLMNLSEQCRHEMKIYKAHQSFDYTGNQVTELINNMKHTRMSNVLGMLIKVCEDNNIDIESIFNEFGDIVPPYRFENEKPVQRGFVVPPEDKWISVVHQTKELLMNANRIGNEKDNPEGSRYIQISDTLATQIADKLNELLKGGNEDVSIT
jgi:DNA-directed RNA polymerase subunit M/transcription elongation factor TFIIS